MSGKSKLCSPNEQWITLQHLVAAQQQMVQGLMTPETWTEDPCWS
jgi:hypothetical protein